MNDAPGRAGSASDDAEAHLAKLNGQVEAMRAVLVQLLQEVVVAEARLDHGDASLLQQANERLIVSALDAQTDAETAHGALDEVSRAGGLDALTGLPNRTVLLDHFELAISHARRHGHRVALLFLDLDNFKQINDTLGHAWGDQALQLVADCLASLVRETDTVSRHGGDEFLVLLAEVASADDAQRVADAVNAALADRSRAGPLQGRLRASIGIAVYPDDAADARTLIARADTAMYAAKRQPPASAAPREPRARAPLAHEEPDQAQRHRNLREANERLILAALGAHNLLGAAEEVKRRQAELLAMVANELGNPYAPIRLAAATLGLPGAEAALLPRVQLVIEEQAERLARMVREVLAQPDGGTGPSG